jgi:hypothetical protein
VALAGAAPLAAQAAPDTATAAGAADVAAGQDLIYGGRYPDARRYFAALSIRYPGDPTGPALQASALIWWAEAREQDRFEADSIDALLGEAAARGRRAVSAASTDSARVAGLFWVGTALGYRARQADLHGHYWRAVGDARQMRDALDSALALDSGCVDCRLGLAIYDYALARAGFLARLVAHLLGLDGGNVAGALETMRRVGEHGRVARLEARWLYANALVRESGPGDARRDEARQVVADLAAQFPDNPVFRRFLATGQAAP